MNRCDRVINYSPVAAAVVGNTDFAGSASRPVVVESFGFASERMFVVVATFGRTGLVVVAAEELEGLRKMEGPAKEQRQTEMGKWSLCYHCAGLGLDSCCNCVLRDFGNCFLRSDGDYCYSDYVDGGDSVVAVAAAVGYCNCSAARLVQYKAGWIHRVILASWWSSSEIKIINCYL